jgi:NAD(P)H-hydrate repair Nnr-like enzyme with NAD(P)H-hydrate dehydratase domain
MELFGLATAGSGDVLAGILAGAHRRRQAVVKWFLRRALRKAGLPPVGFHGLRHLAGTLMSEAAGRAA